MDIQYGYPLKGRSFEQWKAFLAKANLDADPDVEFTVLLWDDDEIIATGSRQGQILKCIAVDDSRQGEGLTATLLTELQQNAFQNNIRHLFLYTKPKNKTMFTSLFFYPIVQTKDVLLMENARNGISKLIESMDIPCKSGTIGAAVMNCNPFTLGHRYLIETAASECDWFYVFVLSEDKSLFPAQDRLRLVKEGTADLKNVTVQPTGPYLISSATFPTYFLPDKSETGNIHCELDIQIFSTYFAPAFHISRRYVGTEPISVVTDQYNSHLKEFLPKAGIEVHELIRRTTEAAPISASAVRALLHQNKPDALRQLVPPTTFAYLEQHNMI